ncbi:YehS family protein [Serratia sp. D1N4]
MINNDVLRSVRYMLSINDAKMVEIVKLDGFDVSVAAMSAYLIKEGEPGFEQCPDEVMAHFLNGLVFFKRGKDDKFPAPEVELPITNNLVLKKLRVAFELKDVDLHQIFTAVEFRISKPELSALFRKQGSKNYRPCGDQMLRYFLKGLTQRIRGA